MKTRASIGALALIVPLWAGAAICQPAATSAPVASATAPNQPQAQLDTLIAAGTLPDLRWPNFTDYRADVKKFYDAGADSPAWILNGRPSPQALAMIQQFKQASLKGLDPDDYDAALWDARIAKLQGKPSDSDLARIDLALTICAMRYISDLRVGRVNPQHFKFAIDLGAKNYDLPEFIRSQVLTAADVPALIVKDEPHYQGYRRAEDALAAYLKLAGAGDAPNVPAPQKGVRPRMTYSGMPQLVARLRQVGDLAANAALPADPTAYDGAIVDAVKHFQVRHGLEPDGVLGKGTVTELNRPLSYRVRQLDLTLERYRWIPPNFPEPPVIVNIPEFILRTMRKQPAKYLTMKVIVGKAMRRQTPVFAENMRYVIFRPYWNVPFSIQRSELVPKTIRDPDYLADHGFEIVDSSGDVVSDGEVSDSIMSGLRSGSLNIRQKPGPKNALGLVKFIFPNSYNVYMHGTPEPELFAHARRDFSHGCIRVENPVALAAWVLRDKPEWTVDRILAVMNGDTTMQVNLTHPIPVLILYSTAVVDPDGEVKFFNDLYGHDAELIKVLEKGRPYPSLTSHNDSQLYY